MFRSVLSRGVLTLAVLAATVGAVAFGTRPADAQTPVAIAQPGGPYSGVAGAPIQFNGARSFGQVLSYAWSFGDGTSATGPMPLKTYAFRGDYTVTLTVRDQVTGATATAVTLASVGGTAYAGCTSSVTGQLVCGQSVLPVSTGCVLTSFGYHCPGTALPVGYPVGFGYPYTTIQPLGIGLPLACQNVPAWYLADCRRLQLP